MDENVLEKMKGRLNHRGSLWSEYRDENCLLAVNRFGFKESAEKIDIETNRDKTLFVVMDGIIYNRSILWEKLIKNGHNPKSRNDSELILHCFEAWGTGCINDLEGMFAFAIWDKKRKELLIARDKFGTKPLYYMRKNNVSIFASEIKSILPYWQDPINIDKSALIDYMIFRFVSGEKTLFSNIYRLLPANYIRISESGIVNKKYWEFNIDYEKYAHSTEEEILDEYNNLLKTELSEINEEILPWGCQLSSGLDSGLLCAFIKENIFKNTFKTFTAGFEDGYNEIPIAASLSSKLGLENHGLFIKPNEFFKEIPKCIWYSDHPLNCPNSIAIYLLAKFSKQHVNIILAGGNIQPITSSKAVNKLRKYLLFKPFQYHPLKELLKLLPSFSIGKIEALKSFYKFPPEISCIFLTAYSDLDCVKKLLNVSDEDILEAIEYKIKIIEQLPPQYDPFTKMDLVISKTEDLSLCEKHERMNMAAGIEPRFPFFKTKLLEFAYNVPYEHKTDKVLLRKLGIRLGLSNEDVNHKKIGFDVPIDTWFKDKAFMERYSEIFDHKNFKKRGIFKPKIISGIIEECFNGGLRKYYENIFWMALNLELWMRIYIDGDLNYVD